MNIAIFANNLTQRGVGNITTVQIALLTRHGVNVTLFTDNNIPYDLICWSDIKRLTIVRLPRVGTGAFQTVKWNSLWNKIKDYLSDDDLIYVSDMWYGLGVYASRNRIPSIITVNMYWPLCHHEGLWYNHRPCEGCIWSIPYHRVPTKALDNVKLTGKFLKCLANHYSKNAKLTCYKYIYSMLKKIVIDYSIKYFDRIVAISYAVKKKLLMKYPELHEKVAVINLGALLLPYEPPYIPPTDSDELRMLYMSAPIEAKGIFHLIQAVKLALDMEPSLKLKLKIIGGKGNELVEKLTQSISTYVELYPWMPRQVFLTKLQEIIRDVDIVVIPSIWEDTWAGVTTLAMALGRPVLVHDGGALREQVIDGVNGFRVNCLNVKEFARRIIEISKIDYSVLRGVGMRARLVYLGKWAPGIVIQELINVFKEVLRGY